MNKSSSIIKSPIRITKRANLTIKHTILMYIISVLGALIIGGLFISFMGVNPFNFYLELLAGSFKNKIYFIGFIRIVMPLIITSLGVAVAFKMRFWNIGAEGQFIMGAIGATTVGLFVEGLPHGLLLLLMAGAGILLGGIYGLITAVFKVKYGTNETLLTLMLNYIAIYVVQILTRTEGFKNPTVGFPTIRRLPTVAHIDQLFGVDITWIVCILLTIIMYFYFKHTKHGYEISVVGESHSTARYGGMNVSKIILRTVFLSAGIIGLAGMLQVSGIATSNQLSIGITGGVGWTAIIVAWLARLNPFGILLTSILLGILEKGSGVAQSSLKVSPAVSSILQGIILFSVLGFDFLLRYKVTISFKKNGDGELIISNERTIVDDTTTLAEKTEKTQSIDNDKTSVNDIKYVDKTESIDNDKTAVSDIKNAEKTDQGEKL